MTPRRTITVSITPLQDDLLRACMKSGRFASVSEVVRAALRLFEREEAAAQGRVSRHPDTTPTDV
ncbi:ribbon-helix-helix domain-containing protein [Roseomonas elaeocarpi]|uniref:Type II toxin-antitoxin system ParD family antitoxin n=1 Tax=Roseomonas elaeocarpi TaxID=907779 RepID=A0ABV6JN95_9PROT